MRNDAVTREDVTLVEEGARTLRALSEQVDAERMGAPAFRISEWC